MEITLCINKQQLKAHYPELYSGSIGVLYVKFAQVDFDDTLIKAVRFKTEQSDWYTADIVDGAVRVPHQVIIPGGFDIALAGYEETDGVLTRFLPTNSVHIDVAENGYGDADAPLESEGEPESYKAQVERLVSEAKSTAERALERVEAVVPENLEEAIKACTDKKVVSGGELPTTGAAVYEYVDNLIPKGKECAEDIRISDHLEAAALVDYKVYGNSVQDGTASADAPVAIQSVGDLITDTESEFYGKYKVSVINLPFNLFEGDREYKLTGTLNCNPASLSQFIKPGKTYTMIAYIDNTEGTAVARIRMSVGKTGGWDYIYSSDVVPGTTGYTIGKFTPTSNYNNHLNFQLHCKGSNITYKDIMIVEGIYTKEELKNKYSRYFNPTPVDMYLDEPLRRVGECADYIDFKNQRIVRMIEVVDDTGTRTVEESFSVVDMPAYEAIEAPVITPQKSNVMRISSGTSVKGNIEVVYYQDINKKLSELQTAITALGGI